MSFDISTIDSSLSSGDEYDIVRDDDSISEDNSQTSLEILDFPSSSSVQNEYQNMELIHTEMAKLSGNRSPPNRANGPRKFSTSSGSDLDIESNEFELIEQEDASDAISVIESLMSAWFLPALWTLAKIVDAAALVQETTYRIVRWIFPSEV